MKTDQRYVLDNTIWLSLDCQDSRVSFQTNGDRNLVVGEKPEHDNRMPNSLGMSLKEYFDRMEGVD